MARRSRRRSTTLAREHGLAGLRGIGLSGQMHGAVCLDARRPGAAPGDPLERRPRHGRMRRDRGAPSRAPREIAGNIAMPGFTAPKIAWVRKHEPEIYAQHRHGAAAQGLRAPAADRAPRLGDVRRRRHALARRRRRATGRTTCSRRPGSRARTCRGWSRAARPRASSCPNSRARWGIDGHGRRRRRRRRQCRGRLRRRRGTAGRRPSCRSAPRACSSSRTPASRPTPTGAVHAFCHAIPDTWHQMGVILSATDSLNWLSRITGSKPAELADAVGPVEAPSRRDLPALSLGRAHAAQRRRRPRRLRRPRAVRRRRAT